MKVYRYKCDKCGLRIASASRLVKCMPYDGKCEGFLKEVREWDDN